MGIAAFGKVSEVRLFEDTKLAGGLKMIETCSFNPSYL